MRPAAGATGLASASCSGGFAAIVEAYLIYWALVYFVARKFFKFSREWAAPLASGFHLRSVGGDCDRRHSASRPVVPIMVSSLVVIFAVVELDRPPCRPDVPVSRADGSWSMMGLAVKTDGAAVASGAIADHDSPARPSDPGVAYKGRLDPDDRDHGQGLHRRLHRHLGLHSGAGLGLCD
jgi:hypothetical protein